MITSHYTTNHSKEATNVKRNKFFVILTSCVLATLMIVFAISFADTQNVSSVASVSSAKPGDTFTVTVSTASVTADSLGVQITVSSGLTITSGEWLKTGSIATYKADKQQGAYMPGGGAQTISGDIFKVTLQVKTGATGTQSVSVEVTAKNGSNVVFKETASVNIALSCAEHSFGQWVDNGDNHKRTCSVCGATETQAHSWNLDGNVNATCTEPGSKHYTCGCGHEKTETINALGHDYSGWTIGTGTHAGEHVKTCSRCHDVIHEAHTYGKTGTVVQQATCSQMGVTRYTCTVCGATQDQTDIPMKAHTYDNACDDTCNVCGNKRTVSHNWSTKWSSDNSQHWHECSVCGTKKDAASHTPSDWIIDKPAGELTAGTKHKECTVCGKRLAEDGIPATGCKHSKTHLVNHVEATCTSNGYTGDTVCDVCGTIIANGSTIEKKAHTPKKISVEATCESAGYADKVVCSVCNIVLENGHEIKPLGHDYQDGRCTRCGAEDPSVCKHEKTSVRNACDPDCIHDGYTGDTFCDACGTVVSGGESIPALGHDFKNGVCVRCGEKESEVVDPGTTTEPDPGTTTEPDPGTTTEPDPGTTTEPVDPSTTPDTSTEPPTTSEPTTDPVTPTPNSGSSLPLILGIIGGVVLIGGLLFFFLVVKRKKDDDEEESNG